MNENNINIPKKQTTVGHVIVNGNRCIINTLMEAQNHDLKVNTGIKLP